jgi:hypothetical protein
MHDYGTPMGHAYVIATDADKRWGKFHLRQDCVEQITKIVEDIYGEAAEGFNP